MAETTGFHNIGKYELVENPSPGRRDFNVFRDPFLYVSSAQLFFAGIVTAFLLGRFFDTHQETYKQITLMGSLTSSSYYLILFIGGFLLSGNLTRARAIPLFANLAVNQAYNTYLCYSYNEYYFNFLIGLPAIIWLVWSEPGLMEKFGIRKKMFLRDVGGAFVITAAITCFTIFCFDVYGYKFKYDAHLIIYNFSTGIPNNLAIVCFIYMAWNALRERGMSPSAGMIAMEAMVLSLELPPTMNPATFAAIGPQLPFIGLVFSSLMFSLLFILTFKKYHNVFPGVFVLGATQMILHLSGII